MWRGRSRHREALLARHAPRGGCLRPASETSNGTRLRRGVGRFHFHGETRAPPTTGRARADTPQAPGGSRPHGAGHTPRRVQHARDGTTTAAGQSPHPTAAAARGARRRACGAAPARGRSPCGVRRGEGPGPPPRQDSPAGAPTAPDPRADGRHPPQGVFKPPRRNALGTWTARGRTRRGGPDRRPAPRLSRRPSGKAGGDPAGRGPGGAALRGQREPGWPRREPAGRERRRAPAARRAPRPPHRHAENRPPPAGPPTQTSRPPLPGPHGTCAHTVPVPVSLSRPLPSAPALAAGGAGPVNERHTGPARARAAGGTRSGRRGWTRRRRRGLLSSSVNDPSAGSPTETLLRLLLPLDSQVRPSSQRSARAVGRPRRGRSEGLTKPSNR